MRRFKADFERQFSSDPDLRSRVEKILGTYFRDSTSPGLLVYEEFLVADRPIDASTRREVSQEIERAHRVMLGLLG